MNTINKAKFQYRILKKYGVLPFFEGEAPIENVKSPYFEGETFSSWCERVIRKNSNDVFLYGLYQPSGQKHIDNMKTGGKELLELIRTHAKYTLDKKIKKLDLKNIKEKPDSDDDSNFKEDPLKIEIIKKESWYMRLKKIDNPKCLSNFQSKNYTLSEHDDHDNFVEDYGDAARHLIILNDISEYAQELSFIFSEANMNLSSEAADDLYKFIENSSEIDALKAELNEALESDREYIENEHVKLYLGASLCHELHEMIEDMFFEIEDELESLTDEEEFIGRLLIEKPRSTLKSCVDFLLEI